MKKLNLLVWIVAICFAIQPTHAQKKQCESEKETELDLNTISVAKCAIEKWEDSNNKSPIKSRQLGVKISSRRRVVRSKKRVSELTALGFNSISKVKASKATVANIVKLETEIDDSVVMPYNIVSEKPTFFECKTDNDAKCFKEKINNHIRKHFSYPQEAYDKKLEGKVVVRFNINKYGEVTKVTGSTAYENEILKNEAIRIINELPLFSPAKQNNKLVNTSYGVTINFKINENIRKQFNKEIKNAIPFDKVNEIPLFNSCDKGSKEDNLKCFNETMVSHISNNFSYPKSAAKDNISGKVWVSFIIDKKGEIKNIKMNGPKNSYPLKTEAKRLVQTLPKFTAGKLNGKKVHTQYILPINFTLN